MRFSGEFESADLMVTQPGWTEQNKGKAKEIINQSGIAMQPLSSSAWTIPKAQPMNTSPVSPSRSLMLGSVVSFSANVINMQEKLRHFCLASPAKSSCLGCTRGSPGTRQPAVVGPWHLCCHAKPASHRCFLTGGHLLRVLLLPVWPLTTCAVQNRGQYLPSYTSGSGGALAAAHPQQSWSPAQVCGME